MKLYVDSVIKYMQYYNQYKRMDNGFGRIFIRRNIIILYQKFLDIMLYVLLARKVNHLKANMNLVMKGKVIQCFLPQEIKNIYDYAKY